MIKLLMLDVDGVMTDGNHYDREGTVRVKLSIKTGLQLLLTKNRKMESYR